MTYRLCLGEAAGTVGGGCTAGGAGQRPRCWGREEGVLGRPKAASPPLVGEQTPDVSLGWRACHCPRREKTGVKRRIWEEVPIEDPLRQWRGRRGDLSLQLFLKARANAGPGKHIPLF